MSFRWIARLLTICLVATSCSATPIISQSQQAVAASPVMLRQDAVDRLIADAFLPADTAGCVIDAVFLHAGVYNPNSDEAIDSVDQAQLVQECTTIVEAGDQLEDEDVYTPDVDEQAPRAAEVLVQRAAPFELTEASMPAINPGGRATGTVVIRGKEVEYVTITPAGFTIGQTVPVFFALPPGGQDLEITRNVADAVYQDQAVQRGWVVVSPASPGGRWFDDDNTLLIPELMSWIRAWAPPEGDKVHLGGMSNGGLGAFHIAARSPQEFHSLLAYPGYPRDSADRSRIANLVDIPIRMWVGGDDTSWVTPMETTAADLRTLGADVELWVLPGEPHVLQSTSDGVAFFDQLDAARQT